MVVMHPSAQWISKGEEGRGKAGMQTQLHGFSCAWAAPDAGGYKPVLVIVRQNRALTPQHSLQGTCWGKCSARVIFQTCFTCPLQSPQIAPPAYPLRYKGCYMAVIPRRCLVHVCGVPPGPVGVWSSKVMQRCGSIPAALLGWAPHSLSTKPITQGSGRFASAALQVQIM
jgi:hypothetical protein